MPTFWKKSAAEKPLKEALLAMSGGKKDPEGGLRGGDTDQDGGEGPRQVAVAKLAAARVALVQCKEEREAVAKEVCYYYYYYYYYYYCYFRYYAL
jgi:hypothetical protein